jgi:hypothetical protein
MRHAIKSLVKVAKAREQFSSDDIWYAMSYAPEEPRTLGLVFLWAQKLNIIEPLEQWKPTIRASAHRRPIRIWRSKIYDCSP